MTFLFFPEQQIKDFFKRKEFAEDNSKLMKMVEKFGN